MASEPTVRQHTIRSYVLRQGRETNAQKRAWQQEQARYLVAADETSADWTALFGRRAPLVAEIGSGYGEATAALASADSARNYVAFEVHRPGVGALMNRLTQQHIDNVRIVCADAMRYLPLLFADGELAGVNIFFPDPWPKHRHHKRRLVRPDFVAVLARKLAVGGAVHFVSDWAEYAEAAVAVFAEHRQFARSPEAPPPRPLTGYEERAQQARRPINELLFERLP